MNSANACNYITCFRRCKARHFDAAVNNFFCVLHFLGWAVFFYEMNSNWLENKWRSDWLLFFEKRERLLGLARSCLSRILSHTKLAGCPQSLISMRNELNCRDQLIVLSVWKQSETASCHYGVIHAHTEIDILSLSSSLHAAEKFKNLFTNVLFIFAASPFSYDKMKQWIQIGKLSYNSS